MSVSVRRTSRPRRFTFAPRLLAVVISYEVVAYALAGLQATGFMLAAVGSGPIDTQPEHACAQNMDEIAQAAAQWRSAQRGQSHRLPSLESLAVLGGKTWICPDGGTYRLTDLGQRQGGLPDRIAVRCSGAARDHGSRVENPYLPGAFPKSLGWGGSQVIVDGTQSPMATALDSPADTGVRRAYRSL